MIKSFNTPAMQARRAQAGITLIEVSIGLIIAAIIAAAAFIAFQNNSRRSEVREAVAEVTAQISEIQQKFGRTSEFVNFGKVAATSSSTVPALNTYGAEACGYGIANNAAAVTSCPATAAGPTAAGAVGTPNQALLVWESVPLDQCIDIMTATASGALQVFAGTTDTPQVVNGVLIAAPTCTETPANSDTTTLVWRIAAR